MKTSGYTCWKCGTALNDLLLPVPRLAKCKACNADLHVCRMCRFYDTTVNNQCREPIADKVNDKQRSNYCGYYQSNPDAGKKPGDAAKHSTRSHLDALFGLTSEPAGSTQALSAEDEAKRKLAELFGLKDDKKA